MKSLVTECKSLRYSLGAYYEKQGLRQRQIEERKELLDSYQAETSIDMSLLQESAGLQRSNAAADGIIEVGHSILEELGNQSQRLMRSKDSILKMANSIGVSKNILRVIERRQITDRVILYSGMVVLSLILVILWWYFK